MICYLFVFTKPLANSKAKQSESGLIQEVLKRNQNFVTVLKTESAANVTE